MLALLLRLVRWIGPGHGRFEHSGHIRTVILSPEPWSGNPTNKHQLASQLALTNDVLYVDLYGRSLREISQPGCTRVGHRLWICRPIRLPERLRHEYHVLAVLSQLMAVAYTRWILLRLQWTTWRLYAYTPLAVHGLSLLRRSGVLYHCVDHHVSFPQWQKCRDALLRDEGRLTMAADFVVTTSPALCDHCSQWRSSISYMPNTGDVATFNLVRPVAPPEADTPLRMFFHGTLSDHKVDFAFLEAVLSIASWASLILVGDASGAAGEEALRRIVERPNVVHYPSRPQSHLIPLLSEAHVLLLPYIISEHTRYVFPLKLVEYLATGRPIISTNLPAIESFARDLVYYAADASQAAAILKFAVQEQPMLSDLRRNRVADFSWSKRSEEIAGLFSARGL